MLDPRLPAQGVDKLQHYSAKFGAERAKGFLLDPNNALKVRGRPLGADFEYHEGSKVFNSLNGHRLAHYALVNHGVAAQNRLMETMFRKYFKEGRNLGVEAELLDSATEAGLDAAKVAAFLKSPDATEEVMAELEVSHASCNGVPHFTFPSGKQVSGGQEVAAFRNILAHEK